MTPEQTSYIGDILLAANEILAYVKGLDRASFKKDSKTVAAVCMQLIIIGESASVFLTNDEFLRAQQLGRSVENLNLELAAAGPLWALKVVQQMGNLIRENGSVVLLLTAVDRTEE